MSRKQPNPNPTGSRPEPPPPPPPPPPPQKIINEDVDFWPFTRKGKPYLRDRKLTSVVERLAKAIEHSNELKVEELRRNLHNDRAKYIAQH